MFSQGKKIFAITSIYDDAIQKSPVGIWSRKTGFYKGVIHEFLETNSLCDVNELFMDFKFTDIFIYSLLSLAVLI